MPSWYMMRNTSTNILKQLLLVDRFSWINILMLLTAKRLRNNATMEDRLIKQLSLNLDTLIKVLSFSYIKYTVLLSKINNKLILSSETKILFYKFSMNVDR